MNLEGLNTRTQVTFDPHLARDQLWIDDQEVQGAALHRVVAFLDRVRFLAGSKLSAHVTSTNNFPAGAGIASSASAFAALSLAAAAAAGLEMSEKDLSRLARLGSGSACRSVPGGYVEWRAGTSDQDSYAYSIAPPDYWNLVDCIAIVSENHKPTGSTEGHALADTSPLQKARVESASQRLDLCRNAILQRDFAALADVLEVDCYLMHAVMMTSSPGLLYWQPATVAVIQAVQEWRKEGFPVCFTIDAGPNVHVLSLQGYEAEVNRRLLEIPGVMRLLSATPGGPACLIR